MIYGYARISRPTQNIERQIRNITEYEPTAKIFRESYTGTTQVRPEWLKLIKRIKPDDTIIFDSVSRMSRNAEEGFTVKNSYTPGKTSVTVTKVWDDMGDRDGKRPEEITVLLLADGKPFGEAVTLNAENGWQYIWTELDEYTGGSKIVYTISESAVDGYVTVVEGDAAAGFVLTNTHEPETVEISVEKTWSDNNNSAGKRPASITVRLRADGADAGSATITEKDGWKYTFHDLPKYADGKLIVYTVTEDPVKDYTTVIDGYSIRNTYTPPSKGPDTGDPNRPWLYLLLLALSGTGIFVLFGLRKKKKA